MFCMRCSHSHESLSSTPCLFCTCLCLEEKISKRKVHVLLVGIWLYALLWAVFPLLGWGRYGPEPFGLSCTLAWGEMKEHSPSFVISMFSMNLAIPAVIIISCYFGIALRLYVSYKSMDSGNLISNTVKMQRRLMVVSQRFISHIYICSSTSVTSFDDDVHYLYEFAVSLKWYVYRKRNIYEIKFNLYTFLHKVEGS